MGRPAMGMASAGSLVRSSVSMCTSLVLSSEIRKSNTCALPPCVMVIGQRLIARKLAGLASADVQRQRPAGRSNCERTRISMRWLSAGSGAAGGVFGLYSPRSGQEGAVRPKNEHLHKCDFPSGKDTPADCFGRAARLDSSGDNAMDVQPRERQPKHAASRYVNCYHSRVEAVARRSSQSRPQ